MTVAVPLFHLGQGWWTFLRARSQFVYKFRKILSYIHVNFEEQIKILDASIIIINCLISIINVHNSYNRITNSQYKYIIFKMKTSSRNKVRQKIWK